MDPIKIGTHQIGEGFPCFIIAEAGVNHNGDLKTAKRLIEAAAQSGADAVKFQTFKVDKLILEDVGKAPYQTRTTDKKVSQADMLRRLQIDENFHSELQRHCKKNDILFLSTPYDDDSLNLLISLDVAAIKVASTDATNLLFLEKIAASGKPVILSTGMCTLFEIEMAYRCLRENGCEQLIILKCTSDYPTSFEEVNLRSMATLSTIFDTPIGFSDHTEGIGASPYAVALGAKVIEKHFTLDKNMTGPDHKASLSPSQLSAWIEEIRKVEEMLGSREIFPTKSELVNKKSLQKCIVTKMKVAKGVRISRDNITAKRTGGIGISALYLHDVIGLQTNCDIGSNKPVHWWMLGE